METEWIVSDRRVFPLYRIDYRSDPETYPVWWNCNINKLESHDLFIIIFRFFEKS